MRKEPKDERLQPEGGPESDPKDQGREEDAAGDREAAPTQDDESASSGSSTATLSDAQLDEHSCQVYYVE